MTSAGDGPEVVSQLQRKKVYCNYIVEIKLHVPPFVPLKFALFTNTSKQIHAQIMQLIDQIFKDYTHSIHLSHISVLYPTRNKCT